MEQREYNRMGLPLEEVLEMKRIDEMENALWVSDFLERTKDTGVAAL